MGLRLSCAYEDWSAVYDAISAFTATPCDTWWTYPGFAGRLQGSVSATRLILAVLAAEDRRTPVSTQA